MGDLKIVFFMPSPYHIRSFVENGFYHVFNRGVEKKPIFRDKEDFQVFHFLLRTFTLPPNPGTPFRRKNFFGDIFVVAFCLMPNHFHFLLQQHNERTLPEFMRSLINTYTLYFNKKYDRVGSIFQGRYKSKMIDSDEYLLHVSRYIHLNPKDLPFDPFSYPYSSIHAYIKGDEQNWIHTKKILEMISTKSDNVTNMKREYKKFCLSEIEDSEGSDLAQG